MERRSIFELVDKKRNLSAEISRIENLLNKSGVVTYSVYLGYRSIDKSASIIEYIDAYLFKGWKSRGTCISCLDFKDKIGLNINVKDVNINYVLSYCEYAANLIYLIKTKKKNANLGIEASTILDNIRLILSWYGFELKPIPEEEKVLVVQKSAQATAVAEIIDKKLAYSVIDYNHFLLKGDIEKKKAILLSLGSDLESKDEKLKKIDEELKKNISFLLNNFNIRHNNCSPEDKGQYKEYVANLKNSELEKWYDELYQLILLAYLLLDNEERNKKIKELKNNFKSKKETGE